MAPQWRPSLYCRPSSTLFHQSTLASAALNQGLIPILYDISRHMFSLSVLIRLLFNTKVFEAGLGEKKGRRIGRGGRGRGEGEGMSGWSREHTPFFFFSFTPLPLLWRESGSTSKRYA